MGGYGQGQGHRITGGFMPALSRSLSFIVSASALLGLASLMSCSGSNASSSGDASSSGNTSSSGSMPPDKVTDTGPTFHKDVEPILQKSCMGCHSTGNIAPFALTAYENVKPIAALIASTTRAGTMPPFAVQNTDECTTRFPWKGDIRLSAKELDLLEAWSKAGAPEGDPKDAPSAFVPKSPDLTGKTLEVKPKTPYVTSGDKDEFRCFVMDPGLTEDTYLNGLQVVPGNSKVVHHAVIMIDKDRQAEKLAGPDGSYPCAGAALPPGKLIDAWAPGSDAIDLPAGVGYPLAKGSLVTMQIHYHPAGTTAAPDATRLQLRLDKAKPKYGFSYRFVGNFDFPVNQIGMGLLPDPADPKDVKFLIPANSTKHVETEQFTVLGPNPELPPFLIYPPGARVFSHFLHMHYLGFDQKITLSRATEAPGKPKEECLVHAPGWDFSWQRNYAYDAPIDALPTLEPGDVIRVRCTYNNTTSNPYVAKALAESHMSKPIDVTYGEGETFDEMCLVGLSLIYPMP
jgi:hypothetical protein